MAYIRVGDVGGHNLHRGHDCESAPYLYLKTRDNSFERIVSAKLEAGRGIWIRTESHFHAPFVNTHLGNALTLVYAKVD